MRAKSSPSRCSTAIATTANARAGLLLHRASLSQPRLRKLLACPRRISCTATAAERLSVASVQSAELHSLPVEKFPRNSCRFAFQRSTTTPGSSPCWISGLPAHSPGYASARKFRISRSPRRLCRSGSPCNNSFKRSMLRRLVRIQMVFTCPRPQSSPGLSRHQAARQPRTATDESRTTNTIIASRFLPLRGSSPHSPLCARQGYEMQLLALPSIGWHLGLLRVWNGIRSRPSRKYGRLRLG